MAIGLGFWRRSLGSPLCLGSLVYSGKGEWVAGFMEQACYKAIGGTEGNSWGGRRGRRVPPVAAPRPEEARWPCISLD